MSAPGSRLAAHVDRRRLFRGHGLGEQRRLEASQASDEWRTVYYVLNLFASTRHQRYLARYESQPPRRPSTAARDHEQAHKPGKLAGAPGSWLERLAFEWLPQAHNWRITSAFVAYVVAKLALLLVLMVRYEALFKELRARELALLAGAPTAEGCLQPLPPGAAAAAAQTNRSSAGDQGDALADFLWLSELHRQLGTPFVCIRGVGVLVTALASSFALMTMLPFELVHRMYPRRLTDFVAFLLEPRAERKLVRRELVNIALTLGGSQLLGSLEQQAPADCQALADEQGRCREAARLVAPSNLSAAWHAALTRFLRLLWLATTLGALVCIVGNQLMVGVQEVVITLDQRLAALACHQRRLVPAFGLRYPAPEAAGAAYQARLRAYLASPRPETVRGQLAGLSQYLALLANEAGHTWRPAKALAMVELMLVALLITGSLVHVMSIFVTAFLDKNLWLLQIQLQLKSALEQLQRQASLPEPPNQDEARQVSQKLTVAYLNFELFRRRNPNFRWLVKLLLALQMLLGLAFLVVAYVIAARVDSSQRFQIAYSLTSVCVVINFSFIIAAYNTRQVDLIMGLAVRVQAHAAPLSSVRGAYSLELWRRQFVAERERKRFFAFGLVGHYLSYQRALSLNAYIAVAAIILFRMSGQRERGPAT